MARPTAPVEFLQTERLTLRRLSSADASALFLTTGDTEVMRYWTPGPDATVADAKRRIAEIERHWQTHGFGDWGIEERTTGELIGFSGLHYIAGMPEVNVGYVLRRDRWGQGFGTEVCRAVLEVGFATLGLAESVAVIALENAASRRLAERCGLSYWKAMDWLGRPRVVHRMTYTQYVLDAADVVTAGAYVVWRGRYVFVVGFPGDATDRLGVVRLGGHRDNRQTAAPLLVGWRPVLDGGDSGGGSSRRLSLTFLAEGLGDPQPAAETQGLLLVRSDDVQAIAQAPLTLGNLLDRGAETRLRTPLPTHLPLQPLTQLRVLAILLDRHPDLSVF